MNRTLQDAKRATQNLTCSEHNQKVEVSIEGNSLVFKACCDGMREKALAATKKAVTDSVKQQISNIFNS